MPQSLGTLAKEARLKRDYSLASVCVLVDDLGGGSIDPSQLKKMEDGVRPGDTRVWGAIWKGLGLPLRDLYEGLGLPVPDTEPHGPAATVLAMMREMPEDAQELMIGFAQHASSMAARVRPRYLDGDNSPMIQNTEGILQNDNISVPGGIVKPGAGRDSSPTRDEAAGEDVHNVEKARRAGQFDIDLTPAMAERARKTSKP